MSMQICRDNDALCRVIDGYKDSGERVGFVPTMGALHAGHLSLVTRAKAHAQRVVVSIFVNPTQFAPGEDFEAYPRDIEVDLEQLRDAGVDCVYVPRESDIYPDGRIADIKAGEATRGLESDFRPHFFDGVCSVVHRLFTLVRPDVAVFGEKDYQQLMVIREMVAAYNMGVDVIGAPIVRDAHGLALSSRNAYLSDDELAIARRLNVILRGDTPTAQSLIDAGFDSVDYIEQRWGRQLAAAWIGKTRLIDNVVL